MFFSTSQFVNSSITLDLETLQFGPSWILLFLVATYWKVNMVPWPPGYKIRETHNHTRPRKLILPYQEPSASPPPSIASSISAEQVSWSAPPPTRRLGNMDANRADDQMFLTWAYHAPAFTNDFQVYLWEPQKQTPSLEFAKILLCPAKFSGRLVRLVMCFSSARAVTAFSNRRKARTHRASTTSSIPAMSGGRCSTGIILLPIRDAFDVMVDDTVEFLEGCRDEVSRMVSQRYDVNRHLNPSG